MRKKGAAHEVSGLRHGPAYFVRGSNKTAR